MNLARFSEQCQCPSDLDAISDLALQTASQITGCREVSLLVFNLDKLALIHNKALPSPPKPSLSPRLELSTDIIASVAAGGDVITVAQDRSKQFFVLYDSFVLSHEPVELRIPFFSSPQQIAILNLGPKESGTDYSSEEIHFLKVLTDLITLSCRSLLAIPAQEPNSKSTNNGFSSIAYKRQDNYHELLGESPVIRQIREIIDQVAQTDASVLVTGESGTGKELVAREIHRRSLRRQKPMVIINCASIPDSLVESELFGHEKGSFTGAWCQRKGKFEFADQSTLFLDEIGDMSLNAQAKLMRVLQDGTFQRVGGNNTLQADVRIIAATNKDLLECVRRGEFREDLYYRINVVPIYIPPLRERLADISVLVEYYYHHYDQKYQKNLGQIPPSIMATLLSYKFPGNVRELKNIVERIVIMGNLFDARSYNPANAQGSLNQPVNISLAEIEKKHIQSVLRASNFNKSEASRLLGITRKTLREKLDKYHLE